MVKHEAKPETRNKQRIDRQKIDPDIRDQREAPIPCQKRQKNTQNSEFCIALNDFHGFCTESFMGKIIQR